MPRESGVSSTRRLLDSIAGVSGILDHPLSRVMTHGCCQHTKFLTDSIIKQPVRLHGRHCERQRSNPSAVIPGWSEGPDPESRDSGFDASHRPGMTVPGLLRRFRSRAQTRRVCRRQRRQNTATRSRRWFCASFGLLVPPSPIRGRGECRAPDAPDSRVCNVIGWKRTRVSQVTPESPGIPHAMVYGL
jgi:hypothetical protein